MKGYIVYTSIDFEGFWPIEDVVYISRDDAERRMELATHTANIDRAHLGYSIIEVDIREPAT